MNLLKLIKKDWMNLQVKKEKTIEYYLQNLVHQTTGFEIGKICVVYAEKTNMKMNFNKFIFYYKDILYSLNDGNLVEENENESIYKKV